MTLTSHRPPRWLCAAPGGDDPLCSPQLRQRSSPSSASLSFSAASPVAAFRASARTRSASSIRASNAIVDEIPVGIRPGPIAAGQGSIWVGNLDDRNLTRIDVAQRAKAETISLDDRTPTGLAFGEGAVWVAHGLLGEVSRVDPQFKRVTNTRSTVASPSSRTGAVAVGEGSVWAVFGDSTLARIDPVDVQCPTSSPVAGPLPSAVVVGNGAVWVANVGDSTVQRFNPATFEEGAVRTISVGSRPLGLAFGEGAIWVANTSDDSVTRIDPFTFARRTIDVGPGPTAVAVGAGAVWVANTAGSTISRVDPATNRSSTRSRSETPRTAWL